MKKRNVRSPLRTLPYQQRLRGYEKDKEELLRVAAGIPAGEFQRLLDQLILKWGI